MNRAAAPRKMLKLLLKWLDKVENARKNCTSLDPTNHVCCALFEENFYSAQRKVARLTFAHLSLEITSWVLNLNFDWLRNLYYWTMQLSAKNLKYEKEIICEICNSCLYLPMHSKTQFCIYITLRCFVSCRAAAEWVKLLNSLTRNIIFQNPQPFTMLRNGPSARQIRLSATCVTSSLYIGFAFSQQI